MDGNDLPPIIVKKVSGHGGHHGGAWKVAYADFVTAMMALFIVLWILGSSEQVKQSVSGYFKDPIGFEKGGYKSPLPGQGAGLMPGQKSEEEIAHEVEKNAMDSVSAKIKNEITDDKIYKEILNKLVFEQTQEGLRIEMIEESDNIFFELGSAQLSKMAKNILRIIAAQLVKLPNKIQVEGHTDSKQFRSEKMTNYSNWELSTERALAARRELVIDGIPDSQFGGVVGFADKKLREPADPFSHKNRRISIIVKYSEKK